MPARRVLRQKLPTTAPLIGSRVDYWAVMGQGGPPSVVNAKVRDAARLLGGHTWVLGIEGKSGVVALDHCRPSSGEDPWPKFVPAGEHVVTFTVHVGANNPEDAARRAVEIMMGHSETPAHLQITVQDPAEYDHRFSLAEMMKPRAIEKTTIDDLDLSMRCHHGIIKALVMKFGQPARDGWYYWAQDITGLTEEDLVATNYLSVPRDIDAIKKALGNFDLALAPSNAGPKAGMVSSEEITATPGTPLNARAYLRGRR